MNTECPFWDSMSHDRIGDLGDSFRLRVSLGRHLLNCQTAACQQRLEAWKSHPDYSMFVECDFG